MPKKTDPKVYKPQKKVIDENEYVCVRYKNLDRKQLKYLKDIIAEVCRDVFVEREDVDEV